MSTKAYVNHSALSEIYEPLERTDNLYQRSELLIKLQDEMVSRHINLIARTCFDLKVEGSNIGEIAYTFGLSKLKVQRLIRFWSAKTNSLNPLFKYAVLDYMDMSYLVQTTDSVKEI